MIRLIPESKSPRCRCSNLKCHPYFVQPQLCMDENSFYLSSFRDFHSHPIKNEIKFKHSSFFECCS